MTDATEPGTTAALDVDGIDVPWMPLTTPVPTIRPSTVSLALARGALGEATRLEIGVDPLTRVPALRIVDNHVANFLTRSSHPACRQAITFATAANF